MCGALGLLRGGATEGCRLLTGLAWNIIFSSPLLFPPCVEGPSGRGAEEADEGAWEGEKKGQAVGEQPPPQEEPEPACVLEGAENKVTPSLHDVHRHHYYPPSANVEFFFFFSSQLGLTPGLLYTQAGLS